MPKNSDSDKRIGELSSLTQFSGITTSKGGSSPSSTNPTPAASRPVNINIPIDRAQHQWLNSTAALIRSNNPEPQPGSLRTYPAHLVTTAIDLLRSADVDWTQIKNVYELKRHLNI